MNKSEKPFRKRDGFFYLAERVQSFTNPGDLSTVFFLSSRKRWHAVFTTNRDHKKSYQPEPPHKLLTLIPGLRISAH